MYDYFFDMFETVFTATEKAEFEDENHCELGAFYVDKIGYVTAHVFFEDLSKIAQELGLDE